MCSDSLISIGYQCVLHRLIGPHTSVIPSTARLGMVISWNTMVYHHTYVIPFRSFTWYLSARSLDLDRTGKVPKFWSSVGFFTWTQRQTAQTAQTACSYCDLFESQYEECLECLKVLTGFGDSLEIDTITDRLYRKGRLVPQFLPSSVFLTNSDKFTNSGNGKIDGTLKRRSVQAETCV